MVFEFPPLSYGKRWLRCACAAASLCGSAWGAQIDWSGSLFSKYYNSSGVTALDGSFTFALGTFGGFNPTAGNVVSWGSNWKQLDVANWTPALSYFSKTSTLSDNNIFAQGEKAYIWVYNTTGATTSAEWALISAPAWTIPVAPGNALDFPQTWTISNASEIPLGGLNGVNGAGDYKAPSGAFQIQTHSLLSLIPEPSALCGLVLCGALLLRRRR